MYIYPKYLEETSKSNWIVRMLKAIGVLQVIGCAIAGAFIGGPYISLLLLSGNLMDSDAAAIAGPLLGLAVGIFAGLWTSLAVFALAQVIDDLHALRIQTEAFVAFETDEPLLGR